MPPGTPYKAFIPPYSIRVDEFTELPHDFPVTPTLHLLTHTHTDHIVGLSSKSFGYIVICSHDAKEMLLRHEVYTIRHLYEERLVNEKKRTFAHLRVGSWKNQDGTTHRIGRDLLRPVHLNTPTIFELSGDESVQITLLDANHCPGAVMFLVEGSRGSVLHTGDLRAEPWFLESLTKSPFLQPYLKGSGTTLDAIFLDTASVWSTLTPPTKQSATRGLVEMMRLFSLKTHFFLNVWTWGYEDILKAVAVAFETKIHVDRYKYSVLTSLSDNDLQSLGTRDETSTRFHACERFDRCDHISHHEQTVVYVNPVLLGVTAWEAYLHQTVNRLEAGEQVRTLLVPLWRHSSLPELKSFVDLFRPHRVIPNTLEPQLGGLDWHCIHGMFKPFLSMEGQATVTALQEEIISSPSAITSGLLEWAAAAGENSDVGLKNLEGGEDAKSTAKQWSIPGSLGTHRLRRMKEYLTGSLRDGIEEFLKHLGGTEDVQTANEKDIERAIAWADMGGYSGKKAECSDEETDDDDERGRTAHELFASLSDQSLSQPSTPLPSIDPQFELFYKSLPKTSPRRNLQLPTPEPPTPRQRNPPRISALSMAKSPQHTTQKLIKSEVESETFELFENRPPETVSLSKPRHGEPTSATKKRVLTPSTSDNSPKRACKSVPYDTSTMIPNRTQRAPLSPRTLANRNQRDAARAERKKMAERLARAAPERVVSSYNGRSK